MSQQSVLSYFKSTKRSNPEQHAAKKRKVILQSHEIESLLKTEHEEVQSSDESDAEEDDQSPSVNALHQKRDVASMQFTLNCEYSNNATERRCSTGSDWWGRHRYKGS